MPIILVLKMSKYIHPNTLCLEATLKSTKAEKWFVSRSAPSQLSSFSNFTFLAQARKKEILKNYVEHLLTDRDLISAADRMRPQPSFQRKFMLCYERQAHFFQVVPEFWPHETHCRFGCITTIFGQKIDVGFLYNTLTSTGSQPLVNVLLIRIKRKIRDLRRISKLFFLIL